MARNDTKHMESVIAVFEELSFTLAAQKTGISQPMLTRNVAEIEAELGVRLFERNRKTVKVTDAGQAYVEKARLSLLYGERAFQAAREIGQNQGTVLHVGKSPYTDPALTSILLSIHLSSHPDLRIELSSQYSCNLAHELLAGAIDLAIATEPPASRSLTTVRIAESPFYIAMSERDELATLPALTLDAMAGRRWVIFERRLHPPLYDSVMKLADERKIVPSKIHHVTAPEEAFPYVADGSSLAFLVKAGALVLARNGITVRPLVEQALCLRTYLASRSDNKSKVASELVRAFMTRIGDLNGNGQRNLHRCSA
jgi:DNA-binding transcriptional LysR family regulator